jgi:transglutaminase/protease-like cytokinesis protein 3
MVAQEPEIDVSFWTGLGGYDAEAIHDAMYEALAQNPNVFVHGWSTSAGAARSIVRPNYLYSRDEATRRQSEMTVAVASAVERSGARDAANQREAVALLHRYIAGLTTYDYVAYDQGRAGETIASSERVAQGQEAYGALVEKTAVCNGYAKAFQLMASDVGITSVIVTGDVREGPVAGRHAWNRVLVDGQWLTVDVTWDDAVGTTATTDYLLLPPDAQILLNRTPDLQWVVDANADAFGGGGV